MSWNSLATETQQQIVDHCWTADQAYERRTGDQGKLSKEERSNWKNKHREWWGRSCTAMSLVSKTLRSMTLRHLFSTISSSQMSEPVFSDLILGSPLCSSFTTVDFDIYSSDQLKFALNHVLPHLPRIDSFEGLDRQMTEVLFGPGGMAKVAKWKYDSSKEQDNSRLRTWRKFKTIASRIKKWKLELEVEEVEALISIDPAFRTNIISLSLSTPEQDGFAIAEEEPSRFAKLLSTLTHLETLSISQGTSLENEVYYRDTLSKSFVSTSYPFTSSLTSFTFCGNVECTPIGNVFLDFLTRFTALRHLRIEAWNYDDSEEEFTFPNLTSLELIGSDPGDLDKILDLLTLPKLEILELDYLDFGGQDTTLSELNDILHRLNQFASLRYVYLSGGTSGGLLKQSLDFLSKKIVENEKLYTIEVPWQPGEPEARMVPFLTEPYWGYDAAYAPKIKDEEVLEGIINGVEQLQLWAGEEAGRIKKSRDLTKARQLLRTMEPIWELKKWEKD